MPVCPPQTSSEPLPKKHKVFEMTVPTATTPPPIQAPTAKEKKYDRQLRLWAAAGQQALEEAKILLINNSGPSVVGIETLKNLILPGVGSFTILDNAKVTEQDLGVNFFLIEDSLGKSRAEECCRYLQELNPDVEGFSIQESIESKVYDNPNFLHEYTLIILIGPQDHTSVVSPIAKQANLNNIPLFYIQCSGFYSRISVQLPPEFPIVDTHPDPESSEDLRLLSPWPELLDFMSVKTANLNEIADHEHGHIPYVLLLLYFLERWKETHEGNPPQNYKQKGEFRKTVQAAARTNNPEGGEENFDEAANAVLKSLSPPETSSGLRKILETANEKRIDENTSPFWFIAHAISTFHSSQHVLPLPGSLPDMKAQSSDYVQLQNIYKAKSRRDIQLVTQIIRDLEKPFVEEVEKGRRREPIKQSEIEAWCKNAGSVKLVEGRALRTTSSSPEKGIDEKVMEDRAKFFEREIQDEDSLIPIYLSFMLLDELLTKNLPINQSETQIDNLLSSINLAPTTDTEARTRLQNTFNELTRGSGPTGPNISSSEANRNSGDSREESLATYNELHNIAALTGGMVAQEVIKVLTKQYVPIEDTCVFDGIQSRVQVFRG